ncbi:MAG: YggS family pyridoxal phosphate-dependent enzyme [Anaerolineales bacterium]|nr:YggS family pyridoxal phosphate-dependent enzyme [Anaerolineales bacterium]MCB8954106.1 YggS family pyridoxal phosphate-dependent enzyme [Ardenticatenales bacterium]
MNLAAIAGNYAAVQDRIEQAARNAGRNPQEITLVAVTKTWPAEVVLAAYEVGMRHFGENRPEEMAAKRQAVESVLGANSGIVWHGIGTTQSRKTELVAESADVFHALDRLKIARRLSVQLSELGRELPTLLEVNITGEASKAGFDCTHWETDPAQQDALLAAIAEIRQLPGLSLCGLMTMAPWDAPPADLHATFARARRLAQWLTAHALQTDWRILSMGMTDDFEIAIAEGATHVRVGRAIFGERVRR